ncbi:hypothetical protein AB6A40_001602 [Gnathostoma spinigerum]|uniref:Transmembrane protein 127 transmembrane region domain-containing protein n=1 Tax=Gnathostoma spinigerum TaxID=75299 RepID=A0ABD6EDH3_9BILA
MFSIKCGRIDVSDSNFVSAFLSLLSSSLAVSALVNNEWILIDSNNEGSIGPHVDNRSSHEQLLNDLTFLRADVCRSIGTRHFWRSARFGSFVDMDGNSHIAYHFTSKVLIDCITPLIADLFYILIALCFVIVVTSSLACSLNLLAPAVGFFLWLRRTTILEVCNMILALLACSVCLLAESQVADLRPQSSVYIGPGLYLVALSGLLALFAAVVSLRRTSRLSRERRMHNQRILCARSLRSWRDIGHRADDARPIIDFERYLDSSNTASPLEMPRRY